MQKLELLKERKDLYNPSAKAPALVEVPEMQFITISGQGNPNSSLDYQAVVSALFSVSYILKFMVKKGPLAVDYKVMPLEGQWWSDDMLDFVSGNKDNWKWNMMIRQPEFITAEMFAMAIEKAKEKAKGDPAVLEKLDALKLEKFEEGKCATIMHLGPFSAEGPTVAGLHKFITDTGLQPAGKHREIYLSDIRKAAPEKWKTVIRQPVSE